MDQYQTILSNFEEHAEVLSLARDTLQKKISMVGKDMASTLRAEGTIFWCGNGGSAADSQHLAAEFVGRFKNNRPALRSQALTTDTSILTCVANDFSYSDIFSRQLKAIARPNDMLVGISTSGNSENILSALKTAKVMGLKTVGLLGRDGGAARSIVDFPICVPSLSTARIQETHILIGHILCDLIEQELGYA